jgi:UDP-2,3-diacylglucosamine hydrolase
LGKLAELRDSGILFISSWGIMICGWKIISEGIEHSSFHDNQEYFWREDIPYWPRRRKGPGDLGYKRMKKVFTNPFSNGFSMVAS